MPSSSHHRRSRHSSHSRSRSPRLQSDHRSNPEKSNRNSQRSRSPTASRHRHHSHHRSTAAATSSSSRPHRSEEKDHRHELSEAKPAAALPYEARQLGKRDFTAFLPLLAYYLDLQKQKDLMAMDEREAKGRWKSFFGKWNRAGLAPGWYDPTMFARAEEIYAGEDWSFLRRPDTPQPRQRPDVQSIEHDLSPHHTPAITDVPPRPDPGSASDSDADSIGPAPAPLFRANASRPTASVPGLDDLRLRSEDRAAKASASVSQLRHERKLDRTLQKERLEELVPRADPGSHERKLEKKAELRDKLRPSSPGAAHEVDDGALMGDGDSLAEAKRLNESAHRRKTERERLREEVFRAKEALREERLREYREKEDATVQMLKEFARTHGSGV